MLACLRMILAYRGMEITEKILVRQVALTEGGLDPENLAQLAKRYGLQAKPCQLDLDDLINLVQKSHFPIVLVDRSILGGNSPFTP